MVKIIKRKKYIFIYNYNFQRKDNNTINNFIIVKYLLTLDFIGVIYLQKKKRKN